jgi:hypothetical protein
MNSSVSAPTWGIVMLANEPEALLLANVGYHLGTGAQKVYVYLDNPADPLAGRLSAIPGCEVTLCTPVFWRKTGPGRPMLQTKRQIRIASHAYRQTNLDWLVHLDADEFIVQQRPLAEELQHFPRGQGFIRLQNQERAYYQDQTPHSMFEGGFRIPFRGGAAMEPALFRDLTPFFAMGVAGHAAGKAAVPTGFNYKLLVHAPRKRLPKLQLAGPAGMEPASDFSTADAKGALPALASASSVLLHFDGLTPLHWMLKILRYSDHPSEQWPWFLGPHRQKQLEYALRDGATPASLGAFHDRLKAVTQAEATRLTALGLFSAEPFDPIAAIERGLDAPAPDLSATAFDAILRAQNPEMLAGY